MAVNTPEKFSAWPEEKKLLHDLVMRSPGDFVIEIGCYQGATSRVLADACAVRNKKLVCIDPWSEEQDGSGEDAFNAFLSNVRQYQPIYHRARSSEVDVTPYLGKCALVFIDGLHTYEGVKADIAKFSPCCAPGGWIACHDYFDLGWPGVRQAVDLHFDANEHLTMHTMKYNPSAEEKARYEHGVSGIAYWQPNP